MKSRANQSRNPTKSSSNSEQIRPSNHPPLDPTHNRYPHEDVSVSGSQEMQKVQQMYDQREYQLHHNNNQRPMPHPHQQFQHQHPHNQPHPQQHPSQPYPYHTAEHNPQPHHHHHQQYPPQQHYPQQFPPHPSHTAGYQYAMPPSPHSNLERESNSGGSSLQQLQQHLDLQEVQLHRGGGQGGQGGVPTPSSVRSPLHPPPLPSRPPPHQHHQHQQGKQQQQGGGGGGADNVRVVVRVRPLSSSELEKGDGEVLKIAPDSRGVQVVVPGPRGAQLAREFSFHACVGHQVGQAELFSRVGIHQLLEASLAGYSATIFAYGQTGSGKTYTMSGKEELIDKEDYKGDQTDGIITRSLLYLFDAMKRKTEAAAAGGATHSPIKLSASYLEIYNEAVYDLLEPGGSQQMPVRWDARRGFFVPGLSIAHLRDSKDAFYVVHQGTRSRTVGSHALNKDSSRSHSLLTVHVESSFVPPGGKHPVTRFGKVCFVDLAGSERLKASGSAGDTALKETGNINRSLFALGKVIAALGEGRPAQQGQDPGSTYIPYRDSKLTKLLMDSLGGSSLALMIATCSPAGRHVEETLSTLYYATTAKHIKNKPTVQMDPGEQMVAALRREVALLREENALLRDQLSAATGVSSSSTSSAFPLGGGPPANQGNGRGGSASAPNLSRSNSASSVNSQGGKSASRSPSKHRGLDPMEPLREAPGGANALAGLMKPEDIDGLSKQQLVKQLKRAHQLLTGYAERYSQLSEEHEDLSVSKNALESSFNEVLSENELLEGKLEHLEAVFVTNETDMDSSFQVTDGISKVALDRTFPKVLAIDSPTRSSPKDTPKETSRKNKK